MPRDDLHGTGNKQSRKFGFLCFIYETITDVGTEPCWHNLVKYDIYLPKVHKPGTCQNDSSAKLAYIVIVFSLMNVAVVQLSSAVERSVTVL